MADWASAIAQGLGAAADTGAQEIGNQIKNDQQLQNQQILAQQAADIQLDLHQRMAAADNLMKNAALQRYSAIVKGQMGVPTAASAPTVQQTGLTAASFVKPGDPAGAGTAPAAPAAAAESDDDEEDGAPSAPSAPAVAPAGAAGSSFTGDANKINGILKQAQDTLRSPGATPEQKADAKDLIDALQRQIAAQDTVNKDGAKGKTRARTLEEAVDAANTIALQDDPEAYVAGTSAYNNANKDDIAEKRLTQQAALAREAGARQERMAQSRQEALMAKLSGAGSSGHDPADVSTIKYLQENGMDFNQARDLVLGTGAGALKDAAALATTLAASGTIVVDKKNDPPGTTAFSKALSQILAGRKQMSGGMLDTPGPAAPGAVPASGNDPMGLRPLIGK